jgi:hypothetical protein
MYQKEEGRINLQLKFVQLKTPSASGAVAVSNPA